MMKAAQQESYGEDQADEKPQEWFYRTVILYIPDDYSTSYAKWFQYGGLKSGRGHLENLMSELLPT